ncbi:putative nf-x1 finger and helicase [Rosellinia necatrix]|uniref:Putative nf-x1 finger and helicase n=1 Tax=Rosellinia necatrix TaxID=77044 RepID=A0A1W2TFM9_ROSNE|nr:putative nf-x1 finger and helicase [Rosellinia necatrix]
MDNPRLPKKPCLHFGRGKCTFGARCRFSHDLTNPVHGLHGPAWNRHASPSAASDGQRSSSSGRTEDDLLEWKRLLRQGRRNPNRAISDRFFQLAVKLVEGDPSGCQEAVKLLADEDGLSHIRLLVEKHIPNAVDDCAKQDLWAKQMRPLFALITHQHVVDSAVLEQQVAAIYNFLQGVGSRRMKTVFDFAINLAQSAPITTGGSTTTNSSPSKLVIAEACLAVLSKMIDCNTSNIIDQTFKTVTQRVSSILQSPNMTSNDFLMLQSHKWLRYINCRLGIGDELPSSRNPTTQRIGSRAEFTLPKTLPGRLSASGRRHDNDHHNIADISILPTRNEVISSREEYLPSNDPSTFHMPGIRGRLDREFRLLREDTVGQLRDAVRDLLETMQSQSRGQQTRRHERQGVFTYMYENVEPVSASFERLNGLDLLVGLSQPKSISRQKRREWWTQSKRLQPGALVCVISEDGSVLFCVVAETTIITGDQKGKGNQSTNITEETPGGKSPSLADDDEFAYVHLNLAELTNDSVQQALSWYQQIGPRHRRCLVEFPGVLLASFQHTLEALKMMSRTPNVPFVDLLAPLTPTTGTVNITPPQYSTKADFYFDLECLAKDGTKLRFSPTQHLDSKTLTEHSTLDETQSSALLDSLSRGLALIQGPPGTGKSYTGEKIIKVLLANKQKGNIGPILCVCYTNHALDQLLEHLLDDGVKQIIRIGSRSKSERLESVNLRAVARSAPRTKPEKSSLWEARETLDVQERIITTSLTNLEHCLGRSALEAYLSQHHPQHHLALFGTVVDEDGFQEVRRQSHQLVDQWLRSGQSSEAAHPIRRVEQLALTGLWTMSHTERHLLYNHWQREIRDPIIQDILDNHKEYVETVSQRNRVTREVDLRCLSDAGVIGVTTTGLARNLDLLRRLRCKVLICEEAGEVLEAHNLTALLPSIEHCILIGDHLQLRPQIQNYDLSSANPRGVQYSLDVSLFERLVKPSLDESQRLPFSTLDTQRRMHPSISELIRKTLYPSLVDGGGVAKYPEVMGMKKRLFWFQHSVPEDRAQQQDPTSNSHTNAFEIGMTVALVQHLVRQGTYGPDDIAVITPYLGQLHSLRREMQTSLQISVGDRDLEELSAMDANDVGEQEESPARVLDAPVQTTLLKSIRLATVDNFQGEEAKVVVISLVRSNNEKRCGFLNTPNRINVLLSRARHGMYIISNSDTYERIPMWAHVITMLKDKNNIGPTLELQCPRHPDHPIEVSTPDHFLQFSPEGGCLQQCDQRLSCGHACINRCHSQVLHSAVRCLEPCPRPKKGCEHHCKLSCGDKCEPKCVERLTGLNISLPCGHKITKALCWQFQDLSSIICKEPVVKTVPGCNHAVTVLCNINVTSSGYRCTSICGDPQSCGHTCQSQCHRCKDRNGSVVERVHHEVCQQLCNRPYTACRHGCRQACHGKQACPPCSAPCEVRCSHSKCSKKCHEPCAPCAEQCCSSACPHQKCTMPCAAPCDWIPCSRRCEQLLACGHQCPSLCGEACPDQKYCQICGTGEVRSTMVDFIMGMEYHEINLDEDPCIFPDCGHFITKTNMDGIMDLKAHYEMSAEEDSSPVALSSSSTPFSMDEVKTCPTCRGSLRNIARYGRIVRRAMLDEATKKFISWSHSEFLKLAGQLVDVQVGLEAFQAPVIQQQTQQVRPQTLVFSKGRLQQLNSIRNWINDSRYKDAIRLWEQTRAFIGRVRTEEQPLQLVANYVRYATRQRKIAGAFAFDESALQVKGVLQASALSLRCEITIFANFMTVRKSLIAVRPEIKLDLTKHMEDCEALIDMAKSALYPREQAEGHIYLAQFCAFARTLTPEPPKDDPATPAETSSDIRDRLRGRGLTHLAAAGELVDRYPSIAALRPEVEAAQKMLRDAVFYASVSAEEMRAVYRAMAGEFSGTGHWYTCANGHPFTIGECGMPMQQARCPECAAPVGGTNHQAVEGVRHAHEIEDLARGVMQMGI